jgi:hypothetical protein
MEADSGVVSWRVVKLIVVVICFTPSSAQVDVDMVLRRVSVVEVDSLVWARTGFERAKYILKDRYNLIYSTKVACFATSF